MREPNLKLALLTVFSFLSVQVISSQEHISKNNHTGAWEMPSSWEPEWTTPQYSISGYDVSINGYITVNGSLSFSGTASSLDINDTLVIRGNLTLDNNNDVYVKDNGILIIRGNLIINNQTNVKSDGYLVVLGNIIKNSSDNQGSFTSNDDPVKVFIGGTISSVGITDNNPTYPALNCQAPPTAPYPNSSCSYGNMLDILNDPIYSFLQTTCTTTTPTINPSGPTTFCEGGSVTLTSSTGTTYLWSTGAATPSINVTATGSYTVKVTDAYGCLSGASAATEIMVNALPAIPTITASGPITFCIGGSVTLTSSSSASYLWSNGATTRSIHITEAGSYSVRITDVNGCQSSVSATTTVNVNTLPVVDAGTDMNIPNGTSTSLDATVSGDGPFMYSWSPSALLVDALIEDPTTVNLSSTTVYTLTVTSEATSCSNADEVTVTISGGLLSTTPAANPSTICAGKTVQLHALASGGSGLYTYTWSSTPTGFTSSEASPAVHPDVSTVYQVTVFDGFNTVDAQVSVTVNALPATPVISTDGPMTFCDGDSVILTASAATGYYWSNDAGIQSINVSESGSYTVVITDLNGCRSAASASVVVTVNPIPVTPVITADGPTNFCEGGSVTLTSSAGTNYLWSNGATSQGIVVTETGSYSVSIIGTGGCQSAYSVSAPVIVHTTPETPTITASGPTSFCAGGSVTLTSSVATGYIWSTGATSLSIDVVSPGSFTVSTTDENGCRSPVSAPAVVEINELPLVNITSSEDPMCTDDMRILTASPTGGTFIISSGPGTISGDVLTATGTGIIAITYAYTDICSNKADQSINVVERPVVVAGPDQELRYVFETQMNAVLSAGESGEWSLISGSGQILDIHSPVSRVTGLSTGDNKFLWTVWNGSCMASAEVTVTVHDLFVPSVITPNGDGKNDCFKIDDVNGEVEMIIFNRWGNVEYSTDNYQNNWDGKNNKGIELPNDTYFYILNFKNGNVKKGSILIKR
jgi:gliding motility-associated-like protein